MELGVLINFAHPKVGIMRMLYNPPDFEIEEDYERMLPHVDESDKEILRALQRHIKNLGRQYGLGYPEMLYRKLIAAELAYQNISCISDLSITVNLDGHKLGEQPTPFLLIADRFLLQVRSSIKGVPTHDFIKTRTYLSALGLKVGWVVNFGQDKLQIHATVV
jgi:GxxExxY protein